MRVDAPVGHILFGAAIPCVCKRSAQQREQGERLRRMSGLNPRALESFTFDRFDPALARENTTQVAAIKKACQDFASTPWGWIILVGVFGTGKTHLAAAIVNERIARGQGAFMTSWARLLQMLRSGFDDVVNFQTRFDMLCDVPLLVIDDLGAENSTQWANEQLYLLLNHRLESQLPMIMTSNVNPLSDSVSLDGRVLSRLRTGANLREGWSRVLHLPGRDVRSWTKIA